MRYPSALFLLLLLGCHPHDVRPDPDPTPDPQSVSDCKLMCDHIGPEGLGCEEGEPVYDSDFAGEPGVPNRSCEQFCEKQQANGLDLAPRCVAEAQSCEEIETVRQGCEL